MNKISENLKKVFESKIIFGVLCGIVIFIVALLIFSAGIDVGFHKASFQHAWGENYERNFGISPTHPIFGDDNLPNANGAIGKIIKIQLPSIIVEDRDNTEKVVLIKNDTQIQEMRTRITANDLKIDDFVVIIGAPDTQGQIEAKFIRVMPLGMPIPPTPTN